MTWWTRLARAARSSTYRRSSARGPARTGSCGRSPRPAICTRSSITSPRRRSPACPSWRCDEDRHPSGRGAGARDGPLVGRGHGPRLEMARLRRRGSALRAAGPIESIRDRFFDTHRRVLTELADVSDAQLDIRTWFWESEPMPIRFRMHRIEEHLRQHTIQLDKTLAVIRPPTEAHRLVRNIYNALADVETATDPAEDLRTAAANIISERAAAV